MSEINTVADVPVEIGSSRSADVWRFVGRYGALLLLLALIIGVSALEPSTFPTKSNLINVLNQSALAALIAMGLTFPLVAGEFDLSIGYNASLGGVIACALMGNSGVSIPLAFAIALAAGAVIGLANGLIITRIGVNALVATLGVGTIVIGINYIVAGGVPLSAGDHTKSFIQITLGEFLGIPYPVYIMALAAIVLWVVLNRTVTGQSMQAVGGNPVAARLSGVRVDRVRVIAFVICGVCAAATGVLLASRTGSASVAGGETYLLSAFAAAFFGSAVMRDGEFHIVGTLIGVITVAIGFNAIALIGLETSWQYLFQGLILILGVGIGTMARRRVG
jgi:ribose transport system permease protein